MSNAAQQKQPEIDYASTHFLVPDEGKEGEDIRHAVLKEHKSARVVTSLPLQRLSENSKLVIVTRAPENLSDKRERLIAAKNARRAAAASGTVALIPQRALELRYVGPVACAKHWNRAMDELNMTTFQREFGGRIVPATLNIRDEGGKVGQVLRVRYA